MVAHRARAAYLAGVLGWLFATTVRADATAVVNGLRASGCKGAVAAQRAVTGNAELDEVARELARGTALSAALARVGYPALSSTSFHVRGSREDATTARLLAERHCTAVNDTRYTELGAFQVRDETWIVLAARQAPAPVLEAATVARRVLVLVNEARGKARTCGSEWFAAAGPLTLSVQLTTAALLHATDMAQRRELSHRGADGSDSGVRITRAGYEWRASGENVAAGQKDADAAVAAWLASPGHCATLMGPYFTEMGIGFAFAPRQNPGIYWAQTFAAPR